MVHTAHHMLASDLDGTLIPPPSVEEDGGIVAFRRAATAHADLMLAYVTGRHKDLALQGIVRHALPPPQVLVCDVGTSVFLFNDGEYEPDPEYRELMSARLAGANREELRRRLAHPRLRLQEEAKQAEYKLSFYTPGGAEGQSLARWATALLDDEIGGATVVYSVDAETGVGLLDVLPSGVAKDVAVRYLHDRLGLDEDRLVYAGDSGNDRAAMLSGFNVVVVANAASELKTSIQREAENLEIAGRIYFARSPYALGVLEGCRHFGIL